MMKKNMKFFGSTLLLLLGGLQLALAKEYSVYPTEQEYATLPPYCKEKIQKKNPVENKRWSDIFGKDTWIHMHHYCQGLNDINRYYRENNRAQQKDLLSDAVSQFNYVVGHLPPDSVLLAEVYQNRGRVQLMLGKAPDGVTDLQKSLELNPKISRTYLLLADQFENLKKKDESLQIVTKGLRHIPSSKSLQERYLDLGGQLPYPEPYEKPVEENAVDKTKVETNTATTDKATSNSSVPNTPKPSENNPAIGMPGNPFCRFCPDADVVKPDSPKSKP